MRTQGYVIIQSRLFQDNQSVINIEKSGKNSCTGNNRNIDIRYFFVKEWVESNNMSIE